MTTSTPSDSTNNQSPLNTGLPDLTSVPTSTIPSGTFPTENIPKVIEPVVVQPIVGVPTATTSVINTNSMMKYGQDIPRIVLKLKNGVTCWAFVQKVQIIQVLC